MGERGTKISREKYDELVRRYEARPGQTKVVAREAGVSVRLARRAWFRGWPSPEWATTPIKDMVTDRHIAARAIAEREREALQAQQQARAIRERELARIDAAAERAREAQAIRASLSSAISSLAIVGSLSKIGVPLANRVVELVHRRMADPDFGHKEGLAVLARMSELASNSGKHLRDAMELLRLHLGEPQQILGVVGDPVAHASTEEAIGALGADTVRKAIVDLFDGNVTAEAERLIAWQAERAENGTLQ